MANEIPASLTTWPLTARRVRFDWVKTPLRWLPGDAFGSHWVNQFSFSLVKGEGFFCRTFAEALPQVTDERLRGDVETFIRQEAIHAGAHKISIERYLAGYGVDVEGNYRLTAGLFERALAAKPFGRPLPRLLRRPWLRLRVGIVAAAEHFTCALGRFALESARWRENGGDPVVLDLFTWHSAEEVEHRSVAYDLYRALGAGYLNRVMVMAITAPVLFLAMAAGTARFARADGALPKGQRSMLRPGFWRAWRRSARLGNVPAPGWFLTTAWRFLLPGYHPVHEASTEIALAYIARSPGVRAASPAVPRAAS